MSNELFTLTEDHIKVISNMYTYAGDYNLAQIDTRRPYGNTNFIKDIHFIINDELDYNYELTQEDYEAGIKLQAQIPIALQIILCTASFVPGVYSKRSRYDEHSWELVSRKV